MGIGNRSEFIKEQILSWNSFITENQIRHFKFSQMSQSPFYFFRATNHLYYTDVESNIIAIPESWKSIKNIITWIQGDMHIKNLGFFENADGEIIFDLNDFDESYPSCFYLDLIRFVTSIFLIREQVDFHFSHSEAKDVSEKFLEEYQKSLEKILENPEKKFHYLNEDRLSGFIQDELKKLKYKTTLESFFSKWTHHNGKSRMFDFDNSDFERPAENEIEEIHAGLTGYLESIHDFSVLKDINYFKIIDIARRLHSGLGSQGFFKYYVIINGDMENIVLEVKEQSVPAIFKISSVDQNLFSNPAVRVNSATHALLKNPDLHTGFLCGKSKNYSVKKISPYKFGFDSKDFKNQNDFENVIHYCARAIAYAHSRSDFFNSIKNNFSKEAVNAISIWPDFKKTILELSLEYSRQVEMDYNYYVKLFGEGEIL